MVQGPTTNSASAFNQSLASSETKLQWKPPSSGTPHKLENSLSSGYGLVTSPQRAFISSCSKSPTQGNSDVMSNQLMLGKLPADSCLSLTHTVLTSPEHINSEGCGIAVSAESRSSCTCTRSSSLPEEFSKGICLGPRNFRNDWLPCRQGSAANCHMLVSSLEPPLPMPSRCISEVPPHGQNLLLRSQNCSMAAPWGHKGQAREMIYSEPPAGNFPDGAHSLNLVDDAEFKNLERVKIETEYEEWSDECNDDNEGLEYTPLDDSTVEERSARVAELRRIFLGSRNGSTASSGAEVISMEPVRKRTMLGRQRKVTSTKGSSELFYCKQESPVEQFNGSEFFSGMRAQEMRSSLQRMQKNGGTS